VKVLTVAIDDQDYRDYFNSTSPLDAAALMQLIAAFQSKQPKVIGVDILTDTAEYTNGNYERVEALNKAKAIIPAWGIPIVWAVSADVVHHTEPNFFAWVAGRHEELLLKPGFVLGASPSDPLGWGVPVFPSDRDRAVRRLPRSWSGEHTHAPGPTFAGAVANVYCLSSDCEYERPKEGEHEEVFLSYDRRAGVAPDYRLSELFDCPSDKKRPSPKGTLCEKLTWKGDLRAEADIRGSIVIVGGTYGASRDFFAMPTGERTAGLQLNAQAVRAEIEGQTIREFPRWLTILLDMGVGLLIAFLFTDRPHRWIGRALTWRPSLRERWQDHASGVLWRVGVTFVVLGGGVFVVSRYVLFPWFDLLWLSWVGMLLTGLAFHIAVAEAGHLRVNAEHAHN